MSGMVASQPIALLLRGDHWAPIHFIVPTPAEAPTYNAQVLLCPLISIRVGIPM